MGAYDHLVPRNYLNHSRTDPAPFDFCPIFGPGDAIAERRGQFELLKSRLHLGTGSRVQRVLQKAMSGGPVTVSVLGGSGRSSSCIWAVPYGCSRASASLSCTFGGGWAGRVGYKWALAGSTRRLSRDRGVSGEEVLAGFGRESTGAASYVAERAPKEVNDVQHRAVR